MDQQKTLEDQYPVISGRANRLRLAIVEQLEKLFESNNITLGVPLESRVKLLSSIMDKVERKSKDLVDVSELDDLVGIRVILLFNRNVSQVGQLIESNFEVLSSENTAERLGDTQFGYQSQHYIIRLPKKWLSIPSLDGLGTLKAEIQVRTLAQHIWAAASHKLQYKQEKSVPPPVRRAIHRVSALLETIDLEFERVLVDRDAYKSSQLDISEQDQTLNVDLLEALLDEMLPVDNKAENETYSELLADLMFLGVDKVAMLKAIINKHMDAVAASEAKSVDRHRISKSYEGTAQERIDKGVYYRHVGWIRHALRREFGDEKINEVYEVFGRSKKNGASSVIKKAPKMIQDKNLPPPSKK